MQQVQEELQVKIKREENNKQDGHKELHEYKRQSGT